MNQLNHLHNYPNLSAPSEGALYIKDGRNVPDEKFAVGTGMSGIGTIVKQAKANLMHKFIPPVPPTY